MARTPETTTVPSVAGDQDVINRFAGLRPDSPLAHLRAQKPEVVRSAQESYRALLEPDDPAGVSRYERESIALRAAVLTSSAAVAVWHRARLRELGASDAALAAIEQFPNGPVLSPREEAIVRHTDLLTRKPGAATAAQIADLQAVGLSPRDIVTIAQLIAYLSFEVRVLAGLHLLAEEA